MKRWVTTIRAWGLPAQLLFLLAVVVALGALSAPVAYWTDGAAGLAAAAIAGGVCCAGAVAALTVARAFREPETAWHGALWGMLLRTGIPLAGALVLQLNVAWLAKAHLLVYFLVFYPPTLLVETLLSLPETGARRPD